MKSLTALREADRGDPIQDWDGSVDPNEDITKTYGEVFHELMEVAMSRSPFQIARYVIQSHGGFDEGAGPIMRQQCLREIEGCMEGISRCRINLARLRREKSRLHRTSRETNPDADLDIAENEIQQRREIITLIRKLREFRVFKAILQELPRYSWKEIQEHEPKRWANRLLRQCDEYHQSLVQGLDRGDLLSMKQAMSNDVLPEVGKVTEELMRERFDRLATYPKYHLTDEKTFDDGLDD